jgi:hypothetical protein
MPYTASTKTKEMTMIWTQQDEAKLRAARATLTELQGRRAEALRALSDALRYAGVGDGSNVNKLIDHADAIRDALAPFDSGVRLPGDGA